jgi:hypothetical protein
LMGPPPRLLLLVARQLMLRPVLWLLPLWRILLLLLLVEQLLLLGWFPRRWRVLLFQLRL